MSATVPPLTIIFISVSLALAFAMPIVLAVWLHKRARAEVLPFFVGCAIFLVFALVLESLMHQAVLNASPAGPVILGNIWLYAVYGGLAAGIFEETGRLVAFAWLLRRHRENDANALMYGAGHGGFECMVVLGIGMATDLIFAVMINSGGMDALFALVSATPGMDAGTMAEVQGSLEAIAASLVGSAPVVFILGAVERVFAIIIHLSLSVLVWFAVKTPGKKWLFPAAIGLHAAVDGVTVVASDVLGSSVGAMIGLEAIVGVMAVCVALIARRVWRSCASVRPRA